MTTTSKTNDIPSYAPFRANMAQAGKPVFRVGILTGPGFVPMDMVGIQTVFSLAPGAELHFIWKSRELVEGFPGWWTMPSTTFSDCPENLDVLAVGMHPPEVQNDPEVIDFIRGMAGRSRYVIGVCNGVALLGAAGLIQGKTVASNFAAEALLRDLGASEVLPSGGGVAEDGNLFTAGPGIGSFEVSLRVMEAAFGREMAEFIEFAIEYDPHPPYGKATVDRADRGVVEQCRTLLSSIIALYRKTPIDASASPD